MLCTFFMTCNIVKQIATSDMYTNCYFRYVYKLLLQICIQVVTSDMCINSRKQGNCYFTYVFKLLLQICIEIVTSDMYTNCYFRYVYKLLLQICMGYHEQLAQEKRDKCTPVKEPEYDTRVMVGIFSVIFCL